MSRACLRAASPRSASRDTGRSPRFERSALTRHVTVSAASAAVALVGVSGAPGQRSAAAAVAAWGAATTNVDALTRATQTLPNGMQEDLRPAPLVRDAASSPVPGGRI